MVVLVMSQREEAKVEEGQGGFFMNAAA